MMKMVHHNHQHRPISAFDNDSCAGVGGVDGDGPTTSMCMSMSHHYHHYHHHNHNNNNNNISDVVSGGGSASLPAVAVAAIHSVGSAAVRPLQPFDIISTPSPFKSPGMMAASLGYPFTNAQWKELQRQAMIYKYMMASVPVPPHLLIPTSLTPVSRSPLNGGFNLRLSCNGDPEPGRCRRTDGKKWRCSRDVAPNHKYCERHMHRGRPRSRKLVELQPNTTTTTDNSNNDNQQQIKRARQDFVGSIGNGGSSSQFLPSTTTQPYHHQPSSLSLDKYSVKASNFGSLPSSVPSDSEPRGLDWMLQGDPISMAAQEWHPLMQNKLGLSSSSITTPNYQDTMYLNSYASRLPLFLNPLVEDTKSEKPRGFIDAWSNNTAENNNANANANKPQNVPSNGKLSLSSLDLSMGGNGSGCVDEEMGSSTIQMGLSLMEPDDNGNTENCTKISNIANWLSPASWVSSTTPGGPLAEVLRPSKMGAANKNASNPPSPSGVLQKTLASLSDSSSNSSPTMASSRANSEAALLWFNKPN